MLLVVMIALLLLSLVGASLVKLAVAEHRQLRSEELRLQGAWLAESALDRAVARLDADPDYSGETWSIAAESLRAEGPAAVEITVARSGDQPDRRTTIRAVARHPAEGFRQARIAKELVLNR